jgi:prolyl-tRNA editing enzyme YbaK/EbsC (Cys-tRNA(Pro) deacylase)
MGIDGRVVEFEQTTRTAADAAAAIGCEVGQIVKSLIFKTSGSEQPVIVFTSGANRVSEAKLQALEGNPLGKADADFVRAATGYAIGGVPPFGYKLPRHTFIDQDLQQYDKIWAAAGTPNAVFPLTPVELLAATGGKVAEVKA